MEERSRLALEATRKLRQSRAFRSLTASEQSALDEDLGRIEQALRPAPARAQGRDPYAIGQATPNDLQRDMSGQAPGGQPAPQNGSSAPPPAAPAQPAPRPRNVDAYGASTREAIEAVNFPGFVAGLVTGTFQAIVDATTQQLREYADLVASISRSVDDFGRDNVTDDQARAHLAARFPADLRHEAPAPGQKGSAKLVPTAQAKEESPAWLEQFGLTGETLTPELTEGALLQAGRQRVAEDRLQTLATMVLMGINRVVINDGEIKAKLQFHASARDKTDAEVVMASASQGIAGRSIGGAAPAMMVSTVKANAQADASIKTNLTGEVKISFRSETFPLERFADSAAIQLISRHARWKNEEPAPAETGKPTGERGGAS
jgi:hypothetical protein